MGFVSQESAYSVILKAPLTSMKSCLNSHTKSYQVTGIGTEKWEFVNFSRLTCKFSKYLWEEQNSCGFDRETYFWNLWKRLLLENWFTCSRLMCLGRTDFSDPWIILAMNIFLPRDAGLVNPAEQLWFCSAASCSSGKLFLPDSVLIYSAPTAERESNLWRNCRLIS